MFFKFLNIIFQLCFFILLIILFSSSLRVLYSNVKYYGIVKSGTIVDIDYGGGSEATNERVTYLNKILTNIDNDTVYGGSQKHFNRGDVVKFRYRGLGGNVIFEVNEMKVKSKYNTWDWLSPFILILTSFILYKLITLWIFPFLKKLKNE